MTKKELRAAMKKQNLSLSPEERAAASGRIFRRVAESEPFGTARCVAFFCALPDEPETEEALARWGSARRIVVPRVGGDAMRFFDYVPGALRAGAFRIAEPDGDAMKVGVCYAHQLVGALPVEPHDVFMDYVITNG